MRFLFTALIISFFLLASPQKALAQKEDSSSVETDIAKLSPGAQAELDSMALDICNCLQQEGKTLQLSLDKAIALLQEAQNKEELNPKERLLEVRTIMLNTRPFSQCFGDAKKNNLSAASSQELLEMAGNPALERQKYTAILSSLLAKNCPDEHGPEIFQKFNDFGDEMQAFKERAKE
ncbi:hypothetical protein SapgrDRAFT_2204 [Saprospira grandis DSM 2844]|uniref:Uncharacterized protein n=1 Tax=Saprospira grandis DSM 2844 TaxID=694433 RepID=J1I547_9BACT|nr:hypothetical protein [Saprospira grandis]EJF53880.1 hypothetical protein SapgrDRAFT_2204 [Saprospira grandis DSM 2844]